MRYALAISLSATILLAAVTVAQVYPVRWDDDEPARVTGDVTATTGAAVMGGLRLVPQDYPPVDCVEATEGYLYLQKDNTHFSASYSSVLCICTHDDINTVYRFISMGGNFCENFQSFPG